MKKGIAYLKREPMLAVSLLAAFASLFITKPQLSLLGSIDWHTLLTLFMMLTVLEGFKKENIFLPLLKFAGKIPSMAAISFFLIFCVFFSSMFVTNDVSLIIFVPLTILLFRAGGKERYILPVISMENIAAIRGSLLMPFGSPQNLFLFGQSGISFSRFVLHMLPLWVSSAALLSVFILLLTFLCFFVFSAQIAGNAAFSSFLTRAVGGHEYLWGIGLSQLISNVPASIVLYPFTKNLAALLYSVDTAGLCSIIGSLASVINYRIYVRAYPENGMAFLKVFTLISWAFFLIVAVPGYLLSKYWLI